MRVDKEQEAHRMVRTEFADRASLMCVVEGRLYQIITKSNSENTTQGLSHSDILYPANAPDRFQSLAQGTTQLEIIGQ